MRERVVGMGSFEEEARGEAQGTGIGDLVRTFTADMVDEGRVCGLRYGAFALGNRREEGGR